MDDFRWTLFLTGGKKTKINLYPLMEYKWDINQHIINREVAIVNVIQERSYWIITITEAQWNTIRKIYAKTSSTSSRACK